MNKTNKNLNIALRVMIFASFIMIFVLWGSLFKAAGDTFSKDMNLDGLSSSEQTEVIVERFFFFFDKFIGAFNLYKVELVMLAVTAVLSILTRYKTRMVSFIFRTLALVLQAGIFFSGLALPQAFAKLGTYKDLAVSATDKDSLVQSLTDNGVTAADVEKIADTLTSQEEIANTLLAYLGVPFVLFILVITSIHCLAKRSDPNNPQSDNDEKN